MNDEVKVSPKRPIITTFYADRACKKLVRANHAKWANKAVLNCGDHMQLNHYGALVAEVYDTVTGTLHAVVSYKVGVIEILYRRAVKEGM
jgi:hypothetical protein